MLPALWGSTGVLWEKNAIIMKKFKFLPLIHQPGTVQGYGQTTESNFVFAQEHSNMQKRGTKDSYTF